MSSALYIAHVIQQIYRYHVYRVQYIEQQNIIGTVHILRHQLGAAGREGGFFGKDDGGVEA